MKVLSKRFLSLLLSLIMILTLIPVGTILAKGATYNASSAISYANAHWNDGVGLCAEFVSKCLASGGITIPNKSYYSSSQKSYANNSGTLGSYTNPYTCSAALLLYLSERYTIITNPSSSQISLGDIVFMYGGSSGQWKDGHVGIVISVSNGTPVYAAHNKATNTGKFSSSYPCTYVAKMAGTIETLTKLKTFPTPIKAQTKATGKTTVYNYPNGSAITNKIYDTDLCTIKTIYTNGWCKVTFPLDAGGTETGYVKTSVFFNPNYSTFKVTASKQTTTYPRSNLSGSFGYAASGDTVYVIGHTSSAVQILYPLTSGGYKAGWVAISAVTYNIKYNSNGGTGSMSSSTVKYQNTFKLTTNSFTKTGYTFSGWNAYRSSDKTWYVKGVGWKTASQISSNNYTKSVYQDTMKATLEKSWMSGGNTSDTLTFYAVWKANTLNTYFNANGGTINSDTYKLNNNLVYYKSDNSKYVQTWTYNNKKTNGIVNVGTLGLSKTGHTFSGWGTKASGGTIFDQNDTDLLPTSINSNLKTGSCSSTLYAIWKPNTLTVNYKANGGIINSTNYTLIDDYVCNKSDNSKKNHTWEYNNTEKNGLANATTYGLERDGYRFVGWSTTADGSTKIFDQNDTTVVPTDLTSTIKSKSCTLDMYAIWEKDVTEAPTEVPTEKATETPTVETTEAPTEKVTEIPTEVTTVYPTDTTPTEPTQPSTVFNFTIGDIDGDGDITIMDATSIQLHLAQIFALTSEQEQIADTDKDGQLSIIDATTIQLLLARLIDSL